MERGVTVKEAGEGCRLVRAAGLFSQPKPRARGAGAKATEAREEAEATSAFEGRPKSRVERA